MNVFQCTTAQPLKCIFDIVISQQYTAPFSHYPKNKFLFNLILSLHTHSKDLKKKLFLRFKHFQAHSRFHLVDLKCHQAKPIMLKQNLSICNS